ncbi:DNA-processing protein DprA [Pseudoalteromonas sp. 1181_04]
MALSKEQQKDYWRNETVAFLALTSLSGVGYWVLHKIAESGLGFKNLLKASNADEISKHLNVSLPDDIEWQAYQQQLWSIGLARARSLHADNVRLLFKEQELFPQELKKIDDAPHWIFVQGPIENLHKKSVSVIGTRKPSTDGVILAKTVIAALANKGLVTVSGLALGIDQIAHTESIKYNIPTVAVLGNGIYVEFPKGSNTLKAQILNRGGTVVTEYLPEQLYSAENFVRRNRIQAALCNTLLPIEWEIKSGSAHTVAFAHKYNKKIANVFLPGTASLRPELKFSEMERGASAWEMPICVNGLLKYIQDDMQANGKVVQQSLSFQDDFIST